MSILLYDFMLRALVAALFTGLAAPAVGTYLVQRRLALMGDGLGHVAVTGVALGLLTGWAPLWTAIVVAVGGAVLIEVIRERGRTSGDVALALFFYGGIAGGVLLTGLAGGTPHAQQVPLRVDHHHLRRRGLVTIGLAGGGARGSPSACTAAVRGRPGPGLRPGRRAQRARLQPPRRGARSRHRHRRDAHRRAAPRERPDGRPRRDLTAGGPRLQGDPAAGDGHRHLASLGGITFSAFVDVAPGSSIVLLALAFFAAAWPVGMLLRRRQRLTAPFAEVRPTSGCAPTTPPCRRSTSTSTASTAGTWRCGTATTSTTCTTDTGTRRTESHYDEH